MTDSSAKTPSSERQRAPASSAVTAVILAGGSGTRFWPLSRRQRPKQLLALDGERTLLQATVDRLSPLVGSEDVWVATTVALAEEIRRQLPEVPMERMALEPVGRNTAPAIGWLVRSLPPERRRGVVVVLPADHRVADPPAFRRAVAAAIDAARAEDLVLTLGVVPRWAETGYGYLRLGGEIGGGARRISRFTEKPDLKTAKRFLRTGRYLWNAGIFVFRGTTLLRHLKRLEPQLAAGIEALARTPARAAEIYPTLPSISIDYAVMERLRRLGTIPLDCGWSDLGSWTALAEVREQDAAGNACVGDVVAIESQGNLLFTDPAIAASAPGPIAVLGVRDLVVVRAADAVLVVPKARAQEVRRLLAELEARGRRELL